MRPNKISMRMSEDLFDRYLKGERVVKLAKEVGVSEDGLRKVLRAAAVRRGYAPTLRLDEIRVSPPVDRDASRERKKQIDRERSAFGNCKSCGRALCEHERCNRCGILLHARDEAYTCGCGVQHGVEVDDGICEACMGGGVSVGVGVAERSGDDHIDVGLLGGG